MIRRPPRSTLFPSRRSSDLRQRDRRPGSCPGAVRRHRGRAPHVPQVVDVDRSEEHTSELQSRRDLVCRLLLEKKNRVTITNIKVYKLVVTKNTDFEALAT